MLEVGTTAPDFTLPTADGDIITLSSFRGAQPVVLIFYPGDQTPVCTMQLCGIRDGYEDFTAAGVVVFGVNHGNSLSHRKFSEKHNFQFPLLVDSDRTVSLAYDTVLVNIGPFAIINRMVYVVGKNGKIIFAQRGTPSNETILAAIESEENANG